MPNKKLHRLLILKDQNIYKNGTFTGFASTREKFSIKWLHEGRTKSFESMCTWYEIQINSTWCSCCLISSFVASRSLCAVSGRRGCRSRRSYRIPSLTRCLICRSSCRRSTEIHRKHSKYHTNSCRIREKRHKSPKKYSQTTNNHVFSGKFASAKNAIRLARMWSFYWSGNMPVSNRSRTPVAIQKHLRTRAKSHWIFIVFGIKMTTEKPGQLLK